MKGGDNSLEAFSSGDKDYCWAKKKKTPQKKQKTKNSEFIGCNEENMMDLFNKTLIKEGSLLP